MADLALSTGLPAGVFHPSDFVHDGEDAFVHALRIALAAPTRIEILHAVPDMNDPAHWGGFPGVRTILERWGYLPRGSQRRDVPDRLSMEVVKFTLQESDPLSAIERHVDNRDTSLLVMATRGPEGPAHWLIPSVSESAARHAGRPALFVPHGARGFVDPATGAVRLEHILVPVDHRPPAGPALASARRLATMLECPRARITALHVGDGPPPELTGDDGAALACQTRAGDAVEGIVEAASELGADLLVLATAGRHGILDAFRGSTCERVLRRSPCPVLVIPTA